MGDTLSLAPKSDQSREPPATWLRPNPMILDVLAIIACLVGGYWLVKTAPSSE